MPTNTTRRHLAGFLLPLLAAALACGGLAPAATPLGPGAATLTPLPGIAVDPCSFVTTAEATALAGAPAAPPQPLAGGGCIYFDASATSTGVGLYVLPAAHARAFLKQYVPALEGNGVPLDRTAAINLSKDTDAGDMPAAVNDLLTLTTGVPGYEITKLDGVGSAALWSWHTLDQNQEGVLMAAKPGALVALILHGTATTQEAGAQAGMVTIVKRILANLPANFTVAGAP